MKARRWLLPVLALAILLSGCTRMPTTDADQEYPLPTPSDAPVEQILGEQIQRESESVTFHYVSGDGTSFSTIKRFMTPARDENFCETVLRALLFGSSVASQLTFIPSETELKSVESACGIVNVNLSADALGIASETDTLMMLSCIANTLLSLEDIQGVNILIGGRPVALAGLPVGVRTEPFASITSAYAQMTAENGYFLTQETGTIARDATLYFPAANGDWLVPETRRIEFDSTDYASALIRALRSGAQTRVATIAPMPENVDLLINNPKTEISRSGERVLVLEFSSGILEYLAMTELPEWKAIASIVLTVASFVPDIDAVRITLDGETITSCQMGDATLNFPDGLIHRADFASRIGGSFDVYLPHADGSLEKTAGALSMQRAHSPRDVLAEMFALSERNGDSALPAGACENDILGVSVANGVCTVNFSADFYRRALLMNAEEERGCVYAIVNTLCAMKEISGVRILVEGVAVESFGGEIYLKALLLPTLPSKESEETPAY